MARLLQPFQLHAVVHGRGMDGQSKAPKIGKAKKFSNKPEQA